MSDYIKTNFQDLDSKIDGFKRGEITLIATRPAMGKSTFAQNLSYNAASRGENVLLFSLDMPESETTERILSAVTDIDCWKMRTGNLTDMDVVKIEEKAKGLKKMPLYIDGSSTTFNQIQTAIKQRAKDNNIDLVIVDYLQQIKIENGDSITQTSNEICHRLNVLAKELNVAIVVFVMLSRTLSNKNEVCPTTNDLSGYVDSIDEADAILFLHRPDYYRLTKDNFNPTNITEVHIYRRSQDEPEIAEIYFHPEYLRFMDKPGTTVPNH